ncbi:MAG: hypothetical protein QOE76_1671 [Frankiales bacterium]|jgi:hypothetical protein|nr:hypothetical protein [Frankiales bacterium]
MTNSSRLDRDAFAALLNAQDGLFTVGQAADCGLSASSLNRRASAGGVRRVLPRVYVEGARDLDVRQRVRGAVLYAGAGACLTGAAALHWRRVPRLPSEVGPEPVDVLIPYRRSVPDHSWVRVTRSRQLPLSLTVDGLPTTRTTRALVDAALHQPSYEAVLALVCAIVSSGRTTVEDVSLELKAVRGGGSRLLRQALAEAALTRSVPEAMARALFRKAGLPEPEVNVPIIVEGRRFLPDFRWGRVIVEIESRAHHLHAPGSWEATQRRRAWLTAAGYRDLPITPQQLRDAPEEVITMIWAAMAELSAS